MNKLENILLWIVTILSIVVTYLVYITGGDMLVMCFLVIPMIALRTYKSYLLITERNPMIKIFIDKNLYVVVDIEKGAILDVFDSLDDAYKAYPKASKKLELFKTDIED